MIFPVAYSLYFLSAEVLSGLPTAFRWGGLALTLEQNIKESAWREQTCKSLLQNINATDAEWTWVAKNFKMDLETMKVKTRFLTALAGAVFFLIMQGLDLLGTDDYSLLEWTPTAFFTWLERASSGVLQLVALGLFLVMLYLSGIQVYHSLGRYMN